MLLRTSLVLAGSSRLTSTKTTVVSFGSASIVARSLSSSSALPSSRAGERNRDRHLRRDNDRRFEGSIGGNTVSQYSRNQRFAPDGTRKRLPHPNAKPRQSHSSNQNRRDSRPPRRNSDQDDSMLKFGATSGGSTAAKRDSTVSMLRARNAADEGGVDSRGPRSRDSESLGVTSAEDEIPATLTRGGDEGMLRGSNAMEKSDRHHAAKQKKKEGRGSLLDPDSASDRNPRRSSSPSSTSSHNRHTRSSSDFEDASSAEQPSLKPRPKLLPKISRNVFLPSIISVVMLASKMNKKLFLVQNAMTDLGMQDTRPDCLLKFEDAEMIAAQLNVGAVKDEDASSDLYPRPIDPEVAKTWPLRPPVVTIMGHVDHGKTTLLDKFRSEKLKKSKNVAEGEAGGITQHIGAFSLPISGRSQDKGKAKGYPGVQTITFLDTPGHTAFAAMRSRGTTVADIVVLVVAADDGVMPQTREVIDLVKAANVEAASSPECSLQRPVHMIVALNKIDKAEADPDRVKRELLAAGVELEEFGGDVPCVNISAKTGAGLSDLEETIVAVSELADLRAEKEGSPEGYVIESLVDKRWGKIAMLLVTRGVLEKNSAIIAGTAWCKVRHITLSTDHLSGLPRSSARPGDVVSVTGWREVPTPVANPLSIAMPGDVVRIGGWKEVPAAGEVFHGGADIESVKKAALNRKKVQDQQKLMDDVEHINEARRIQAQMQEAEDKQAYEERQRRRAARLAADEGKDPLAALAAYDANDPLAQEPSMDPQKDEEGSQEKASGGAGTKKFLNVVIKADYSGTVEAVVGAISRIGNSEAGVKILKASSGELTESDVAVASTFGGAVIGFNVPPSKSVLQAAARAQPKAVPVIASDVIYRIMEEVSASVSALLPPAIEARVHGEATVSQIFEINLKGSKFKKIAGCRVTNGTISKSNMVRVLRGEERKEVYKGKLDDFKHVKKDVTEMRKGTECGMSFEGWQDLQQGDLVQSFTEVEVPRAL